MAAFFFNDYSSSGLNDISSLDLPLDPNSKHSTSCPSLSPLHINTNNSSNTNNTMSDSNKPRTAASGGFGSRIPKINFGFRKQTKNGTTSSAASMVTGNSDYVSRSERSTPEGCEDSPPMGRVGIKKPASSSPSSSNNSSPTVGRSKSLRLPRSTYVAKFTTTHSKVDSVRDEAEDFYPDDLVDSASQVDDFEQLPRHYLSKAGQTGLARSGRPRSSTITAASSTSSSRESSPGGLTMSAGSSGSSTANGPRELERTKFAYNGGGSLSQSDAPEDSSSPGFSQRSQSFSAKHQTRLRASSFGAHNRLQPPQAVGSGGGGANLPSRRSKTPTALSQRTSQTGQAGTRNGSSKLALSRTSSLGKVKQQATGLVHGSDNSSNTQPATHSRYQGTSQLTRRSPGEQRGKRPSSLVVAENAADLNAIAQELSQGDADSSQLEVKSIARGRIRPASAKTLSTAALNTRRSHSSIGYTSKTYQRSDTPDQQNTTSAVSSSAAPSTTKSKFLSAGIDKTNRPTSARDYYQHGRKDGRNSHAAANNEISESLLEEQLERAHSVATFGGNSNDIAGGTSTNASGHVGRQSSGGGRSSAPSSGRSTPVYRSMSGNRLGKDVPDGGVVSSTSKASAGLPPRTPYRVARTKATPTSGPAGINELEGSVLLEADDYRRISNDVKSLKTALLKLKRELQVDLEGKSPSSQTPQAPRSNTATPVKVGHSITTPGVTPGPAHSDLRKKLKAITSERDKALEEVGSCKKDLKVKSERISSLMAELEKERKKNTELATELEQVEGQRNRLLDKVERLHADKHNLEARLNTLERASIYEQTFSESWLDELDGDCDDLDIMDPFLGDEGTTSKGMTVERKEMTESEIGDSIQSDGGEGESSEPESAAVCSAPVS